MEKDNKCTEFELMLLFTSYRYCIGRHSYIVDLAYDMAHNYYNRMTDDRKEFAAQDIRKTIMDNLSYYDFNFRIHRMYNYDEFNPLGTLFRFIDKENIDSINKFSKYKEIEYDAHTGEYKFDLCEDSNFNFLFSSMDFDDLIPWETLASLFDVKKHSTLELIDGSKVEAFKSWKRKSKPCEDRPGWFVSKEFGWDEVWIPVNDFVDGRFSCFIPDENIKKIL